VSYSLHSTGPLTCHTVYWAQDVSYSTQGPEHVRQSSGPRMCLTVNSDQDVPYSLQGPGRVLQLGFERNIMLRYDTGMIRVSYG